MPLTTATNELIAIYLGTLGEWISLHTADPSTTGANEWVGNREQTTWTAGASDGVINGSQVTFAAVPADTYTHAGIWSASTAGTFRGSAVLTDVVLSAEGEVKVTPSFTQT